MAGPSLTRTAQALRYLLDVAPGAGHTLIAKFLYLSDLLARQHLGRPITEMEYVYDNHGPFDRIRFYSARDELEVGGFIIREAAEMSGYVGYPMYPTRQPVEYSLGDAEKQILMLVV